MPPDNVPTRLVIMAVKTDQLLYQQARRVLRRTPLPKQEAALQSLVTGEITVWHGRAGQVDISADLVSGLAYWALKSVIWLDVVTSIVE